MFQPHRTKTFSTGLPQELVTQKRNLPRGKPTVIVATSTEGKRSRQKLRYRIPLLQ